MITENIHFKNNLNQTIAGRIYCNDSPSRKGIIFSHGLFSTKDGYKITRLAEDIVNSGHTLMTFDFSFCGESEGNISELSIIQETKDLGCAYSYFSNHGIEEIHLMGSSMGAAVSLLLSGQENIKIRSIITIAAPLDLELLFRDNTDFASVDDLDENGTTSIEGIPINNSFFKEIKKIDIVSAVKNISAPVLIFHGALDEIVNISNADLLQKSLKSSSKKVVIEDGDHNLTREKDLDLLSKKIKTWLAELSKT